MKNKKKKIVTKNVKLDRKIKVLEDKISKFLRTDTTYNTGLTDEEVLERTELGLVNTRKKNVTKSWGKIIYDNFFTFFNVLIYIFSILVIVAEKYGQLMFLGCIMANSIIGFIQDIIARRLVSKLSIVNNMQATVIRNGVETSININELVIDDVILLNNGDQVPADCSILKGRCSANESMLTGEPDAVKKKLRDTLYSGTYITSGSCYARVDKVGILNKSDQIQAKASTFRKPNSEILRSLKILFKVIGVLVIVLATVTLVSIEYCFDWQLTWDQFIGVVGGINPNDDALSRFVGSMVSMIPAGMFLLTSIALSIGVINLAKKRCLAQDMYSIEMLARVDTLCLDKTGTITDGSMSVGDYIKIDRNYNLEKIKPLISSVLYATKDNNFTAVALKNYFTDIETFKAKSVMPFSSETKCSAATFEKIGTIAIGAFGFLKIDNKEETEAIVKKYSSRGYRCLLVCASKGKIEAEKLPKDLTCIGVLLLVDHVRDDAPQILNWFAENGVDIKVISGDDPVTVSEIAKKAGIKNANLYVSLEDKTIEEVKRIATKYSIFGRVSPEQKEALVIALKEAGKCVAMTGDGVNDILALKRADCSIAMASGSDAAKNVSQLVLLDSNFSVLTSVVAEGRRVINNIQRSSSLFLTKTLTSIIITTISLLAMLITKNIDLQFPLAVSNFYIWEIFFIGVGGFLLSIEPNSKKIEGGFLSNALKRTIPAAACVIMIVFVFYILYIVDYNHYEANFLAGNPEIYSVICGTNVSNFGMVDAAFKASCSIGMCFFGGITFYRVCYPFSKYRGVVGVGIIVLLIGAMLLCFRVNVTMNEQVMTLGNFFLGFEISNMTLTSWLWVILLTFICIVLYYVMDKRSSKSRLLNFIDKKTKNV